LVQHLLEKHGFLIFIAWWAVFIGLVFWVDKMIKKEQPERNVSRKQTVAFYCSIIVMVILLGVIEKVFLKDFVIGKSRLPVLLYELPFIILWSLATGLIIRKFFPNKNKQINKTL